jgi:hypothetical protein
VAAKKHVILFLAANPSGTDRLALDREARSIQVELRRSGYRDRFDFVTRWAAEPLDLLRELLANLAEIRLWLVSVTPSRDVAIFTPRDKARGSLASTWEGLRESARPACDWRVKVDQANFDAPLTVECSRQLPFSL